MHPKNIIKPKHQIVIGPGTNLSVGSFYLGKEILQAKLW
jgi:hypothetical protein